MSIEARGLSKRFGTFQAVKDVSFTVQTGEVTALLGPSGAGWASCSSTTPSSGT